MNAHGFTTQQKSEIYYTEEVVTFLDDDDDLDLMREVICEGSDDEFEWNEDDLDDYQE